VRLVAISSAALALLTCVSGCSSNAGQVPDTSQWQGLGKTDSSSVYLDVVHRDTLANGHVVVWLQIVYNKPLVGRSGRPFTTTVWHVEYDCQHQRSALQSAFTFGKTQSDTLDRYLYPVLEWMDNNAGRDGQFIESQVCRSN
jgi:hypothetical protein